MDQIAFTDELTINSVDTLVTSLLQALRNQQKLIIDLTAVERIDTAAAQVLLAAKKQAQHNATTITFICSAVVNNRLRTIGIQL